MKFFFTLLISLTLLTQPALALDQALRLVQNTADKSALSVDDLGFQVADTKTNTEAQKVLNERSGKLQFHQKLGLLTLALVAATAATAEEGAVAPSGHENLGTLAGISYAATAYYSLTAPETPALEKKPTAWNMRIHKAMAFIHLPCMILLPFAGKEASDAYKNNEAPSGLGKNKKQLANLAVTSLAISALSVSFDF